MPASEAHLDNPAETVSSHAQNVTGGTSVKPSGWWVGRVPEGYPLSVFTGGCALSSVHALVLEKRTNCLQ